MKRTIILLSFLVVSFLPQSVKAEALFTVTTDGNVSRSVLGEETDFKSKLNEVAKAASDAAGKKIEEIILQEIENKTHIKLEFNGEVEEQVLASSLSELVNIENEDQTKNVSIKKEGSLFRLTQGDTVAVTALPLVIKPKNHEVFVENDVDSEIKLAILPAEVMATLYKTNIINRPTLEVTRIEIQNESLVYLVKAERSVNILNITTVVVPVDTTVSGETGKVLFIDQPKWLTILGSLINLS